MQPGFASEGLPVCSEGLPVCSQGLPVCSQGFLLWNQGLGSEGYARGLEAMQGCTHPYTMARSFLWLPGCITVLVPEPLG